MDMETKPESPGLEPQAMLQRDRLVQLRQRLREERTNAVSPAIERVLEMADMQLFLALSYLGYTDQLFPEE